MFRLTIVTTFEGETNRLDRGLWDTKRDAEQFGAYLINKDKDWFEDIGEYVEEIDYGKHFVINKGDSDEFHMYIEVVEETNET